MILPNAGFPPAYSVVGFWAMSLDRLHLVACRETSCPSCFTLSSRHTGTASASEANKNHASSLTCTSFRFTCSPQSAECQASFHLRAHSVVGSWAKPLAHVHLVTYRETSCPSCFTLSSRHMGTASASKHHAFSLTSTAPRDIRRAYLPFYF